MDSRTRKSYDPVDNRSETHADSMSLHSNAPLAQHAAPSAGTYPPPPMPTHRAVDFAEKPMKDYDPERGQSSGSLPRSGRSTPGGNRSAHVPRNSSWDLLAGVRQFESDFEHFDTRNASEAHLAFAEGDVPDNKVRNISWSVQVHII
jgi:hypothetical protein